MGARRRASQTTTTTAAAAAAAAAATSNVEVGPPSAGASSKGPASAAMAKGAGLARLVRLEDIEGFRQYNTFIHSGYRVDFRWRDALGSLWYRHNELWNVWTHLGGAAFFVAVTLHSYATWLSDGVWEDWLFYLPYALASVYCCTASSF